MWIGFRDAFWVPEFRVKSNIPTNLTLIYAALQNICNQPWTDLVNPETKYRPCKIQIFILYNILWVLYSIMFLFNVSLDII
jgi:hypothetical protein